MHQHFYLLCFLTLVFCAGCNGQGESGSHIPERVRWYDDVAPPYPPESSRTNPDSLPFAVIVDPGHGGWNTGARFVIEDATYCEDEIAYDLGMRLLNKAKLFNKQLTSGDRHLRMALTLNDTTYTEKRPPTCDRSMNERYVLPDGERKVIEPAEEGGLRQRTKVIAAWYRAFRSEGIPAGRIALLSLHVDSSRPAWRGAFMMYPGRVYDKLRGSDTPPNRSWHSMMWGAHLMYGLERAGVQLFHSGLGENGYLFRGYYLYRDSTSEVRKGRLAIFRDTPPMPKILLETANGRNQEDRQRIIRAQYRQNIADGLFEGILSYSGLSP